MLQDYGWPEIVNGNKAETAIFMHDGARPHIKTEVFEFLKTSFGTNRVISRNFTNLKPANSPDLNPLDFYF